MRKAQQKNAWRFYTVDVDNDNSYNTHQRQNPQLHYTMGCAVISYAFATVLLFVQLPRTAHAWTPTHHNIHRQQSTLDNNRPATGCRLFQSLDAENEGATDVSSTVTLKMAFDSNWGVAELSEQKSERFTCPESLDMVHRLRRCSDAVLVGRVTVERDDCTLTVRRVPLPNNDQTQPVRVILDPTRSLNLPSYKIATDGQRTLIYVCGSGDAPTISQPDEFPNVSLIALPSKKDGCLFARDVCQHLAQCYQIHHIMLEGGPNTARRFLEEGMVDRAILVQAPLCFKEPFPSGLSNRSFEEAGLELVGTGSLGVDRVDYWSRPDLPWPASICSEWP
jgi:riboflavin-specific deaminase-like protein